MDKNQGYAILKAVMLEKMCIRDSPDALRLIEAWGFTYKSVAFVWLKKNKKADSWFYGLGSVSYTHLLF